MSSECPRYQPQSLDDNQAIRLSGDGSDGSDDSDGSDGGRWMRSAERGKLVPSIDEYK